MDDSPFALKFHTHKLVFLHSINMCSLIHYNRMTKSLHKSNWNNLKNIHKHPKYIEPFNGGKQSQWHRWDLLCASISY